MDDAKIRAWTANVVAWEKNPDPKKPSPFEITVETPKQSAVRLELAAAEKKAIQEKKDFSLSPNISPSVLISRGIDLETEQCVSYFPHHLTPPN